jgi:hypothetical protein
MKRIKYIYSIQIFSILFILISCYKSEVTIDQFFKKTFPLIISTFQVQSSSLYLNTDSALIRPPATSVNIMTFSAIDENFKENKFCLFYKMPHLSKQILGRLFLTSITIDKKCKDQDQSKFISEIKNIQQLSIHLNDEDTIINKKRFQKKRFYIELKKNDELRTLSYPLYNYQGKKEKGYSRYSTSFRQTLMKGMMISSPSLKKNHVISGSFKELGLYSDNYKDKSLIICHSFKANCQEDIAFKCDQCRFGWFQAIANISCNANNTKFCGRDQCGGRGMPACIRGNESAARMGQESKLRCYEDSPAGYCHQGLSTSCDGSYLICL